MRWALLSVRIGILVVSIITTMLLLLAVIPLASGGLDIKIAEDNTSGWDYDNSTHSVSFSAPVQIYNGGFYDINDFTVGIKLADPNGTVITESDSTPKDIPAGRTTNVDVELLFDLNDIQPSLMKELAFNHTKLNIVLSISTYYMENLVNIRVGANQTMDWSPLIDNLNVDMQGLQLQQNGTAYDIIVPYSFDAGEIITGQQVSVRTTLRDPSGMMGTGSKTILIAGQNDGSMRMSISQAAAQRLITSEDNLTLQMAVEYQGAEIQQTYTRHWEPLISDLSIGEPSVTQTPAMMVNLPFSFDASQTIVGAQMQMECSLSNSTASISQGSSGLIIGQHTSGLISLPLSPAESAWFLSHSEDWMITLKGTVNGVTVQQTRAYHWTSGGGP